MTESADADDLEAWLSKTPAGALKRTHLTGRELDVLRCISRGLTTSMAAAALGISTESVKHHLKGARYQLLAKNSAHACCEAIRLGLIP